MIFTVALALVDSFGNDDFYFLYVPIIFMDIVFLAMLNDWMNQSGR